MVNKYSIQLRELADLLDKGEYLLAEEMTFSSPAGDGWGMDNTCITFNGERGDNAQDIGMVLIELRTLDKNKAIQEHLDAIERIKQS